MAFVIGFAIGAGVIIVLYACLVAASDADDWSERMHDEENTRGEG